jgi:hypothetical protein
MTIEEQELTAIFSHAARKWGMLAVRYGLVVSEADADAIVVSDPRFDTAHGYRISKLALETAYMPSAIMLEAARTIQGRHTS